MTIKLPISSQQNLFFDSEQLDSDDLNLEQSYVNNITTSLINNQVGNGVVLNTLTPNILFDSNTYNGLFDGYAITPSNQPSDTNYGNQLEVSLSDSLVAGKRTVKVAIIGLDFNDNIQYDTFTFYLNESQITKKHYVRVLLILTNDFSGLPTQSFNLGGRIVIKDAQQLFVSRDPIMVSQDVEPSLFWRDFFVPAGMTFQTFLTTSLANIPAPYNTYSVDSLNISTGVLQNTIISAGDITTQVGEKFLATTNNIQKITLLLGVQNLAQPSNLVWTGDLVVSIYPLQSTVNCATDIVPDLAIDYDPSNIPLAQLSYEYTDLSAQGVILNGNLQPVDFVFSNTSVAGGSVIIPGQYYAFTVKRQGAANVCDFLIGTGGSYSTTSRVSIFSGTSWTDNADQELWFRVFHDAAKITDGQAYETGKGIVVPKTQLDTTTSAQVDYSLDSISFFGNSLYYGVLQATTLPSGQVQDQRTGNLVNSLQQFVPTLTLVNALGLQNLQTASEPFVVGVIEDENQKSNAGPQTINAAIHGWTYVENQLVLPIITNSSDPRYDVNVEALVANFDNGDFNEAQIVPDGYNAAINYRIAKTELITMIYGDVDGDGIITQNDLALMQNIFGASLNSSPPATTQMSSVDGYYTVSNGYPVYTNGFVNDLFVPITFSILDPSNNNYAVWSASDGYLRVSPTNPGQAVFNSQSTNFTNTAAPGPDGYFPRGIGNYNLLIQTSSSSLNVGQFSINGYETINGITYDGYINISKLYYPSSDSILQILRADINQDGQITEEDGYLLSQYLNNAPAIAGDTFPPTLYPSSLIGTQFNVLRFTLEEFIDRADDFPSTSLSRATTVHTPQDIFLNDTTLQNEVFIDGYTQLYSTPIIITKQFTWEDYLIAASSGTPPIPTIFTDPLPTVPPPVHTPSGITYQTYPLSNTDAYNTSITNVFAPNDIIIGKGDLRRPDGSFYKVDFEVGSLTLEIPPSVMGTDQTINIFDYFVADNGNGNGITRFGYPAMRFADYSVVPVNAIANNQVRFSVAVQSFFPQLDGYDMIDGYYGVLVDGRMGVYIDDTTGSLRINFANLFQYPVSPTSITKIQIDVYLKKGGFTNQPLTVGTTQMQNLLGLIS